VASSLDLESINHFHTSFALGKFGQLNNKLNYEFNCWSFRN